MYFVDLLTDGDGIVRVWPRPRVVASHERVVLR